jgi:hypothetical protein
VSAWGNGQVVHSRWQALAQCFHPLAQGGTGHVLLCLGIALPQVRRSTLLALRHLLAAARPRLPLAHLCQGESEPPRLVACELRQDITPRLTARVQSLGPPSPHRRPFEVMRDAGGIAQDPAELLPPEGVHDLRGGSARRAARAAGQPQRIRTAPAAVRMGAGMPRATSAREPTLATADQAAESRRLGGMVAAGHVPMTLQAGRGRFAGLGADAGWPRHGTPLRRWGWLLTLARSHRR